VAKRSTTTPVGPLIREWRMARRLSQLDLSLEAGLSARHLSCLETGKAHPSREMIVRLAETMGIPLRERNALFLAARYAPEYPETNLDAPEFAQMRRAIEIVLAHHEPYPAFVLNRHWDILRANEASMRVAGYIHGTTAHSNMLRQFFDPDDLRAAVVNWEEVARDLLRHLHDELAAVPSDVRGRELLNEILRYPGVPGEWRMRDLHAPPTPLLTVVFRKDDDEYRFFSTITRFGTPRDVTLEDLRIECTFPADVGTAKLCRTLAASSFTTRTLVDHYDELREIE
jgi:transcriptional regulator with XRE-family HTH domain